ncbi:MAG: alpha-ketoglutarate-dependent dioxygenase AlkB [Saprospiraceae bacterium]|jgi:alkylated DNA repair dioxygenase AlkB|nr:alpha-ketoglutarate-dependent dioxygenase AlkB [Saprospiraceae bacterium]MBL0026628.1 alpha-ketoglutarate-dependent dioxygenase AlkB [Saprospiraceae bacterium]
MDLSNLGIDSSKNVLPHDGIVHYYGRIMDLDTSSFYFNNLMSNIAWENDRAMMFGKLIITKRKVAWYGDYPFEYSYSNIIKKALPWTPELLQLKTMVEQNTSETYNSCLLNLYHTGEEGMAWHSDDEKDLKLFGAIASLSFGAERKFGFKHKTSKESRYVQLQHGSLLVMKGVTQIHWLHRLPPTKTIKTPRINLTFRTIVNT